MSKNKTNLRINEIENQLKKLEEGMINKHQLVDIMENTFKRREWLLEEKIFKKLNVSTKHINIPDELVDDGYFKIKVSPSESLIIEFPEFEHTDFSPMGLSMKRTDIKLLIQKKAVDAIEKAIKKAREQGYKEDEDE